MCHPAAALRAVRFDEARRELIEGLRTGLPLAPAGTPSAFVDQLKRIQLLGKIVRTPEMAPALAGEGAGALGNTAAAFDAVIHTDLAKRAKIV